MRDILVMDSMNREIFWNALRAGCTVHFAETAEEGLRMLSGNIDLVFLSNDLPDVDNREILRKIKKESPETPVILIASSGEGGMSIGDFGYDRNTSLKKPARAEDVLSQIREILDQKDGAMPRHRGLLKEKEKHGHQEHYPGVPPSLVEGVLKVRDFIANNCSESLSLQDACRMASMSKTYFCRYFKRITGYSLRDYHHVIKVRMAEHLLREKRLSVKTIAKRLGYGDANYFSTVFKKITGESPRHRKVYRQTGTD